MKGIMQCAHCDMTVEKMREFYPYRVRVVSPNRYGIPVGKEFPWGRYLHHAEASPVVVNSGWPALFHGQTYIFEPNQVTIETGGNT